MIDRLLDPIVRRMLQPPRRSPRALPDDVRASAADVTMHVRGMPMKAWLLSRPEPARGTVVVVHGWGSDGARSAGLSRGLLHAGLAVLLVDLPGHGRTGPAPSYDLPRMVDDIATVRLWLRAHPTLAGTPAGLLGISFGGVGTYVSATRDDSWAAIALLGVPMGPLEASRLYLDGKGLPGAWLQPLLRRSMSRVLSVDPAQFTGAICLPRVKAPVLIVHGTEDRVVPLAHAQALASSPQGGEREVHLVAGAGHDLSEDPTACDRVARFFSRSLAGE